MTNLKHHGFTLIEVMAVVFIIGVIVTFASLSIGRHSDQSLAEEAKRLHYLIKLASEESVMRSISLALEITKEGYQFVKIQGDQFVPLEGDRLFRKREFPADLKIDMEIQGEPVSFENKDQPPHIYILSSGEMTPFKITISQEDSQPYTITGDLIGKVELLAPGAQSNEFNT